MARFKDSIVVPRPLREVFDYLADFSTTREWDPGIVAARRTDEGPLRLGSAFELTSSFMGSKSDLRYEIAAYEPPRRVVFDGGNDALRSHDEIVLEATGEGTRIVYDAVLTATAGGRVADLALQAAFSAIGRRAIASLARTLGAGGAAERASRALGALLDPTIVLSYDRTGYRAHALGFREEDLAVDMTGKVCLVTGANSGIGFETALGLAERGATVYLLCRSAERGAEAVEAIRKRAGSDRARLEVVDVSNKASLRAFAARFAEPKVDVLVHNAGVLPAKRRETEEGLETTLATNLVGPFLLTRLLRPKLRASGAGRVIWVSSGGMYARRLDLSDIEWRRRAFDGVLAYALTKRAQVIVSEMLAERLAPDGIVSHAMHPGWADTPAVRTSIPRFYSLARRILRTPAQGADTALWLAVCPRVQDVTGLFWFDRRPRPTHYFRRTREPEADRAELWRRCLAWAEVEEGGA